MTFNQPTVLLDLIHNARVAFRQSRHIEAVSLCQQALQSELEDAQFDDVYRTYIDALDALNLFDEGLTKAELWFASSRRNAGKADALIAKATLLNRIGDLTKTLSTLDEAEKLATRASYLRGLAAISRTRADVLWMRGDSEQALSMLRQALSLYENMRDFDGQIITLISIGITYHLTGRFYAAIQMALKTIALCEAVNDQSSLFLLYNNLGEAYRELYAVERALFYHQKAWNMREAPDADLTRNLGVDLVAVGRTEEGFTYLHRALALARESGDADVRLQALHSLAEALYNSGDLAGARALAQDLLAQGKALESGRHTIRALLILGDCASAENDDATAQQYLHEGFMIAQRTADKTIIWQTHASLFGMLAEKQPALAAIHRMIASDMLNSIALSIEDRDLRDIFRKAPPIARILQSNADDD